MSYTTPHSAHEWFKASALHVCHHFRLLGLRDNAEQRKAILKRLLEIDLCSKMAAFFGAETYLGAQGNNNRDLEVQSPRLDAEVKYFGPDLKNSWASGNLQKDWKWLREDLPNASYSKAAFVIFWPSTEFYQFTDCVSLPKPAGNQTDYKIETIAPFACFTRGEDRPGAGKQKLVLLETNDVCRRAYIQYRHNATVLFEMVALPTDLIWATIYSRVKRAAPNEDPSTKCLKASDADARLQSGETAWERMGG